MIPDCDGCGRGLRTIITIYTRLDGRRTYVGAYGRKCARKVQGQLAEVGAEVMTERHRA